MTETMRVARLHAPGEPFQIDGMPIPEPGPGQVLVRVRAAGLIPNMRAVVSGEEWYTLPPLPAVYGLDAAGTVEAAGPGVVGWHGGERVYVNPALWCGGCPSCRDGRPLLCDSFSLRGYFSTGPYGTDLQRAYPYGAFSEYLLAPVHSLVRLPDTVSFPQAARFGYLGTSYHALKVAGLEPGRSVIVNGVTGTLGVGSVLLALAMGATRVLGTGRNAAVLERVAALDPGRVQVARVSDTNLETELRAGTDGLGADAMVDCQGRGADIATTVAATKALRKGGRAVMIGAVSGAPVLDYVWLLITNISITGAVWFTTAEGQEMAAMAGAGTLDLSVWETHAFALEHINDGLAFVAARRGGFVNVVVEP